MTRKGKKVRYRGAPDNPSLKERGLFKAFKEFIVGHLERQTVFADRYQEAKVAGVEATSSLAEEQARLKAAEARKTELEAEKINLENLEKKINLLEQHLSVLQDDEKEELLKQLKGTQLDAIVTQLQKIEDLHRNLEQQGAVVSVHSSTANFPDEEFEDTY